MQKTDFNKMVAKKMKDKPFNFDFYNYPLTGKKKYMIIGQNPGDRLFSDQAEEIDNARIKPEKLSKINLKWLGKYLKKHKFFNDFIEVFCEKSPENEKDYLCFLKKFYFTDVIKYRNRIIIKDDDIKILNEEIKFICPKYIFAFGGEAKKNMKNIFENNKYRLEKINKIEINIFEDIEKLICYLPHYSRRSAQYWPTKYALKQIKRICDAN